MKTILLFLIAFAFLTHTGHAVTQPPVVCLDPGHPSETSAGSTVQNGVTEVHIAWVVALRLRDLLEAKGIRTVMTKSAERQLVKNRDRALTANRVRAAVMVRLHCDASTDSGFALYAPDRQGTTQGVTGPSREVIERSQKAARIIHRGMAESLAGVLKDGGVRGDSRTYVGSRQGALTGSIFSEVPVVTIEMVVLSNRSDAEFIKSEKGQERMARAIAAGIERFIKSPESRSQEPEAPEGAKLSSPAQRAGYRVATTSQALEGRNNSAAPTGLASCVHTRSQGDAPLALGY